MFLIRIGFRDGSRLSPTSCGYDIVYWFEVGRPTHHAKRGEGEEEREGGREGGGRGEGGRGKRRGREGEEEREGGGRMRGRMRARGGRRGGGGGIKRGDWTIWTCRKSSGGNPRVQ